MGREENLTCQLCDCGLKHSRILEITAAITEIFSREGVGDNQLDEKLLEAVDDEERRAELMMASGCDDDEFNCFASHIRAINESEIEDDAEEEGEELDGEDVIDDEDEDSDTCCDNSDGSCDCGCTEDSSDPCGHKDCKFCSSGEDDDDDMEFV